LIASEYSITNEQLQQEQTAVNILYDDVMGDDDGLGTVDVFDLPPIDVDDYYDIENNEVMGGNINMDNRATPHSQSPAGRRRRQHQPSPVDAVAAPGTTQFPVFVTQDSFKRQRTPGFESNLESLHYHQYSHRGGGGREPWTDGRQEALEGSDST
jgi:hypothetical protein